jgi:hypothetical protein
MRNLAAHPLTPDEVERAIDSAIEELLGDPEDPPMGDIRPTALEKVKEFLAENADAFRAFLADNPV